MFASPGRARSNRFTSKPAFQLLSQRFGRVVAPRGILFQTLEGDGCQIGTALGRKQLPTDLQSVQPLPRTRWKRRLVLNDLAEQRWYALCLERRLSEEQVVKNRAKAINIRSRGRAGSPPRSN